MDEAEIERQVMKIKDKNKTKQKSLREEKKKELLAKRTYVFYATAMEYVYEFVNGIDYHKGKAKRRDKLNISDMLKEPKKREVSTAYQHKNKIVEICEDCKKELDYLYGEIRTSVDDDEKDCLYSKIRQIKDERNVQVKELLSEEYVLYLIIKEYEKKKGENWHLYASILGSELFNSMLKMSKEKMQKVVEKADGEYNLYGLKFAKK
jgi:hypothetical protein